MLKRASILFLIAISISHCKTTENESSNQSSVIASKENLMKVKAKLLPNGEQGPFCETAPDFLFLKHQKSFSWENAFSLHWLSWSNLDVHDESNSGQRSMESSWGFDEIKSFEKRGSKYSLYRKNNVLYLTFRHSDNLTNWISNINVRAKVKTNHAYALGKQTLHSGFHNSLADLWPNLLNDMLDYDPNKSLPIYVSGHSLAAAQGELAAAGLANLGFQIAGTYLSGAPKVAGSDWVNAAKKLKSYGGRTLQDVTYRIQNGPDIIGRVPVHADARKIVAGLPEALFTGGDTNPILKKAGEVIYGQLSKNIGWILNLPDFDSMGTVYTFDGQGAFVGTSTDHSADDIKFWSDRIEELRQISNPIERARAFADFLSFHFVRYEKGYACTMLNHMIQKS
ncbi:MAG: hypothetical protein HRU19_10745 [Pseudobacteriovorax sp.]|nr:hypothetical protein [Pseudobacteriovorax sp.]